MGIGTTSQAAGVGVSVTNKALSFKVSNIVQKVLLIGTYDPTKTVAENKRTKVLSAEALGALTGWGYQLHKLAQKCFLQSPVEVYYIAQAEAAGASQATGTMTITGTATANGVISLYIAGEPYSIAYSKNDDAAALAAAIVSAVNATPGSYVTAANTDGVVTFTAKSAGDYWGNNITIAEALRDGDVPIATNGFTHVIVAMSGGAGTPDITDALTAMGTGDSANAEGDTIVLTGYGPDTTTLDAISTYNGVGNTASGLYGNTVGRPLRSYTGDITGGTAGFTTAAALADGRKLDRTNGQICAPGWANHPIDFTAQAVGIISRINSDRASQNVAGLPMSGMVFMGSYDSTQDDYNWASDYDLRASASASNVSYVVGRNGAAILQDIFTYYHPDTVAVANNGYKDDTSIAKLQNILKSIRMRFEADDWQGITIVSDAALVTSATDAEKVRDIQSVINVAAGLIRQFAKKTWLFEVDYAIANLSVTIRELGNGFDLSMPVYLSRDGKIVNVNVPFDTNIADL